jgi:hypothetical protein
MLDFTMNNTINATSSSIKNDVVTILRIVLIVFFFSELKEKKISSSNLARSTFRNELNVLAVKH